VEAHQADKHAKGFDCWGQTTVSDAIGPNYAWAATISKALLY
jgi:hypothetical protein